MSSYSLDYIADIDHFGLAYAVVATVDCEISGFWVFKVCAVLGDFP